MANTATLLLGAVAYDPKVVTIWDGFQAYFERHGLDFARLVEQNRPSHSEPAVRRCHRP